MIFLTIEVEGVLVLSIKPHGVEIVVDVFDKCWILIGSSIHTFAPAAPASIKIYEYFFGFFGATFAVAAAVSILGFALVAVFLAVVFAVWANAAMLPRQARANAENISIRFIKQISLKRRIYEKITISAALGVKIKL